MYGKPNLFQICSRLSFFLCQKVGLSRKNKKNVGFGLDLICIKFNNQFSQKGANLLGNI